MLSQLLISLAHLVLSKTDRSTFLTVYCQSPSTRYHHRDRLLILKSPVQIPWQWPWSQPDRTLRHLSVFLPAVAAVPKLLYDYWHRLLCRPRGNYCCCESVAVSVLLSWSCRNSHSAPWPKINVLITELPELTHRQTNMSQHTEKWYVTSYLMFSIPKCYTNTTCQSITHHYILYTIKVVYCQGDMFRPFSGHLQALWENRYKSYLYFNAMWDPKCCKHLGSHNAYFYIAYSVHYDEVNKSLNTNKCTILQFMGRPASWSSGQNLTTNHEVPGSIPGSTMGIFLEGKDSRSDHGLGRLVEFRFKAPPGTTSSSITTHTSSGTT